ncbi:MAG: DUF402 domain-containing protein [Propionibacteriaceae bacterium]
MSSPAITDVEVHLGNHKPADPTTFGPLPARRLENVVSFEMQAPTSYQPWPGRTRVERKYALLDVGVVFGLPCWARGTRLDGSTFEIPQQQKESWYIDLVTVDHPEPDTFIFRDLFVDLMICPSRQPRALDFDEIADAHDQGWITTRQLTDGLRRWQRFLDTYVHTSRFPQASPTDFPPSAIQPLAQIPGIFGPPVTWPE